MRRMVQTLRILITCFTLSFGIQLNAQPKPDKGCKPPKNRELWHDRIDREQRNALKADGKADNYFQAGNNEDINYFITQAIIEKVDELQCKIERDTLSNDQRKVGYLRGLENLLKDFTSTFRNHQFTASHLPVALDAFEKGMYLDERGESIEGIVDQNAYDVGKLLMNSNAFER